MADGLTYLEVNSWGSNYLSTVLDDYFRFVVLRRLCTTMSARDVSDTLDDAIEFTGIQIHLSTNPRLSAI